MSLKSTHTVCDAAGTGVLHINGTAGAGDAGVGGGGRGGGWGAGQGGGAQLGAVSRTHVGQVHLSGSIAFLASFTHEKWYHM